MNLTDRIARRPEATCQGCRACYWGMTNPCPSQSSAKRREIATWLKRTTSKDLTRLVPS